MSIIPIWEGEIPYFDPEKRQFPATISPYLLPGTGNSCCIVIPGGGYAKKAWDHEGVQIAEWLNRIGMSAVVLDYRIAPYEGPAILSDGRQAIRFVRSHAEEFGIDKDRIGVCGFSAGGHLAGSCATMFESAEERPDFALLCYGVLTLAEGGTHTGTAKVFLGENREDPKLQKQWSPVFRVTKDCPPMFLWTTDTDKSVPPVPNTYAMYEACRAVGVDAEMIAYDHGAHGLGIPENDPEIASWTSTCRDWMKKHNLI